MKSTILLSIFTLTILVSGNLFAVTLLAEQKQRAALSNQTKDPDNIARIVGGQNARQGDYPFMSALVVVNSPLETMVTVNDTAYESNDFSFSAVGSATAEVVSCGLAGEECLGVESRICLIERGDFNFSVKALNCEQGGGIGAIIYNNVEGPILNGTLSSDFNGTIPVVAISQQDGQTISQLTNPTASISVTSLPGTVQNLTCGASFLGDKWVLTAAHCVDSVGAQFFKINIGEYDLRDGVANATDIRRIYTHPNYVDQEFNNDVALLELTESVNAPTIALADEATTAQLAIENTFVTSIGWGGRAGYAPNEGPTSNFPDILQEVDIQLLTNNQCRQIFADSRDIPASQTGISDAMICAAVDAGGRSACQGDSGGPLFAETNQGVIQVGITSWGIGCAAEGYPGVYARVGTLRGWIDATMSGISISGDASFANVPMGAPWTQSFLVTNNSLQSAQLSFTSSNSNDFQVATDTCSTLGAGQSCDLAITFTGNSIGKKQSQISLSTDLPDLPVSGLTVSGVVLSAANNLASQAGPSSNSISWFSGGDLPWINDASTGLRSGNIGNSSSSILLAQIEGEGELTFSWSVSSEENTDEPDEPFDALYLIINGQEQQFISGDEDFETVSVQLTENINLVEWTYSKDRNTAELQDRGRVRDVTFTPTGQPPPTTPAPNPNPPAETGGGGGSLYWLLIILSAALPRRQNKPS